MKKFSPMLATTFDDTESVAFPVLGTPKLDGIRCIVLELNGRKQAVSRSLKPIRNTFVRQWLEENCPAGVDGELFLRGSDFHGTSSAIMSQDGEPDFEYAVFDRIEPDGTSSLPYEKRVEKLPILKNERIVPILPVSLESHQALEEFYEDSLSKGFEGVMLRDPNGKYVCGRSKLLQKMKQESDSEAVIEEVLQERGDFYEEEKVGAFRVSLLEDRSQFFSIGTGFTANMRLDFWKRRHEIKGQIVRFAFQRQGMKHAPRFPVFMGFRSSDDL